VARTPLHIETYAIDIGSFVTMASRQRCRYHHSTLVEQFTVVEQRRDRLLVNDAGYVLGVSCCETI